MDTLLCKKKLCEAERRHDLLLKIKWSRESEKKGMLTRHGVGHVDHALFCSAELFESSL